jgi:hypothetical protein
MNKFITTNKRRFGVSKGGRCIHKYFVVKFYILIKHYFLFLFGWWVGFLDLKGPIH